MLLVLYTTFARLGGATKYIPTDRIIDGLDQTALLMRYLQSA
jgi:arylsulfatase